MTAKVYLVGAGPGDPGLVTARGRELLGQADTVVYDYLAGRDLLCYVKPGARLVDVGKKGFSAHVSQEEINAILIDAARESLTDSANTKIIVRLKGGDPFVFGRGGEEALALHEARIPFEIVPGVTSGIAAASYAGIPVTHRKAASSVTFVTGHEDPTRNVSSLDWDALAKLVCAGNTLCFYMGMRNLPLIGSRLVEHGAAPGTPVALVRWGTMPFQEVLEGDLAHIAAQAQAAGFAAPAVIVVGDVVSLRRQLQWYDNNPLIGRRIVVTRARTQASALSARLQALGATVHEVPVIELREPDSCDAADAAIERLGSFDWLVFTSANGVEAFFERLEHRSAGDARALAGARVAAIGPATARALRARGIRADAVPGEYRAEAVFGAMEAVVPLEGARVLIPRAQVAREALPDMLRKAGAEVEVAPVYKTVPPAGVEADRLASLLQEGVDGVTFTSSSTVKNLLGMLDGSARRLLEDTALFSIGPVTTATLAEAGFEPAAQASEYTIEGLAGAIEDYAASGQWKGKHAGGTASGEGWSD